MMRLFWIILLLSSTALANGIDQLGATKDADVSFEKGLATLSDADKSDIQKAIQDAQALGGVKEIKVLSWADREYPAKGEKASKQSIDLAQARAEAVNRYLKEKLNTHHITLYNMAARPNTLQELFKTQQSRVKDLMEKSGSAPTSSEDTGFLGVNAKSSSALVLVYSKGNPNKL